MDWEGSLPMVEETPQLESFPVPIEESTPGGWRLQKRFAEVGAHWTDFEKDRKNGCRVCPGGRTLRSFCGMFVAGNAQRRTNLGGGSPGLLTRVLLPGRGRGLQNTGGSVQYRSPGRPFRSEPAGHNGFQRGHLVGNTGIPGEFPEVADRNTDPHMRSLPGTQ